MRLLVKEVCCRHDAFVIARTHLLNFHRSAAARAGKHIGADHDRGDVAPARRSAAAARFRAALIPREHEKAVWTELVHELFNLGSILATDRYLPKHLAFRGHRLAFSNGILALAGWVWVELTDDHPLLDLRLFKIPVFAMSSMD